ncbi:hypothetical protein BDV95DRAFT_599783 [Massariosphaeria phaeospora]|uniref:AAA+ ATPase domain-containing protein n=1 Tax=Massariosphaeria phaeospora TaxID=100035 RepID=A0A7C8I1A9_9PLEO|nr:hypothetical protein BDV95DRAFT_599783 [Massariosphaeria phaeospora]
MYRVTYVTDLERSQEARYIRMYAAIRPALRSTSIARPTAQIARRRRYPSPYRLRSFHYTRLLAQNPIPPLNPDNTPVDDNGADKKSPEKATAAEQTDAAIAPEDTEILSQKLQRSRELTRRYSSALRRTQRRNRAQDLPPVHIPDWFLRHGVLLHEEPPLGQSRAMEHNICTISVTHTESGEHGTYAIPFLNYSIGIDALEGIVKGMWKKNISEEQKKEFAEHIAKELVGNKGVDLADLGLENALPRRGREMAQENSSEKTKMAGQEDIHARSLTLANREPELLEEDLSHLRSETAEQTPRIPPLVLTEIRATIAASLSANKPTMSDSFPSAKTNLILHSPFNEHEKELVDTVLASAAQMGSDVVILTAQDLAQFAGDYIGEGTEPSPHSLRSLGYQTYSSGLSGFEDLAKEDALGNEQDAASNQSVEFHIPNVFPASPPGAYKSLFGPLRSMLSIGNQTDHNSSSVSDQNTRTQTQTELQLEDLKISTLLEALIDSCELKRNRGLITPGHQTQIDTPPTSSNSATNHAQFFNYSMNTGGTEFDLSSAIPKHARPDFTFQLNVGPLRRQPRVPNKSKIIYVKDIKELNATQHGSRIMQKLEDIVRKRRNAGENIMIVGTTCSRELIPEMSASGVQSLQSEGDAGFFRTIIVPITSFDSLVENGSISSGRLMIISRTEWEKFSYINLRHIQDMLRCLDPVASASLTDIGRIQTQRVTFDPVLPEYCRVKIMSYDEVHRIALTTLGLHLMHPSSPQLNWAHVVLAMGLLKGSDEVKFTYVKRKAEEPARNERDIHSWWAAKGLKRFPERYKTHGRAAERSPMERQRDLDRISSTATKHEKRLMPGIANPDQLKTTFDQVHVPKDTVEAIRTLTSMSLLRPDAFSYGVLATEKISGALLYGPPGTGKTLLVKAVAKESGSTVLEVSGSQIMDKYVGEGEKNVAAVFSLARKLSPCIVFLDEADAVFASRSTIGRERSSHRDILNQFLKEWDGLNDLSVFVMVATNRPFDLDDAVIRRLPRRLLVDLPTQDDRRKILKIHLRGEELDASVDLWDVSKRTPFYSGSDMKNLAVSAALACVKEENEQAAIAATKTASADEPPSLSPIDERYEEQSALRTKSDGAPTPHQGYQFPEKRILHARHFEKALQEISASISEDMSSLTAIKKFDEQYGDRKGRRKKTAYGFGAQRLARGSFGELSIALTVPRDTTHPNLPPGHWQNSHHIPPPGPLAFHPPTSRASGPKHAFSNRLRRDNCEDDGFPTPRVLSRSHFAVAGINCPTASVSRFVVKAPYVKGEGDGGFPGLDTTATTEQGAERSGGSSRVADEYSYC